MSGAIAVFVKTPGLSPVKTRLAKSIGQKAAEAFHLQASHAVAAVVQELSQKTEVKGYYAVAESAAITHPYWDDLPCLWQGEGGLGERMGAIYQTLLKQHDFVILVGADIPQMTRAELEKAVSYLSNDKQPPRLTFAPSADGGFWLLGGNCAITQNIWRDVLYSRHDTGENFLNKIAPLGEIKLLACLRDVDELSDLLALRVTLLKSEVLLPEQQQLMHFLNNVLLDFPKLLNKKP